MLQAIMNLLSKLFPGGVKKKQLKSYDDFCGALGLRESGGKYSIVNKFGYLGKYQFGMARLCDFNLTRRKKGTVGWGNKSFKWRSPFTEEIFLSNEKLQDAVFNRHVRDLRTVILKRHRRHLDEEVNGHLLTLSGAIGSAHLLGLGGLKNFIEGKDKADALGTKASDYIDLFAGYEIPFDIKIVDDLEELV